MFSGGDFNLYRYSLSNPLILTDPTGLIVFYGGVGASAGAGAGKSAGGYGGFSVGGYFGDTACAGSSSTGNFATGALGSATGLFAGYGGVLGVNAGSIEDTEGAGKQIGITLGPISVAVNQNSKGGFLGVELGLFKSMGFGVFSGSTNTKVAGGSLTRQKKNKCGCKR